jgi:3-oxoacyl-[acyl-carrier-protein] synthase-1
MRPLFVTGLSIASALGAGLERTFSALREGRSGLRQNDFEPFPHSTWIGRVDGLESAPLTGEFARFDCRNNRLAQLALGQDEFEQAVARARERHGAARVAVLLGTTTSGILETELAYRRGAEVEPLLAARDYAATHGMFSLTEFVRRRLALEGPAATVSNACASSAKVFAQAQRLIEAGICDAAVVGGVDSLCLTTLYGFRSLELLSESPCRPCDERRDGISIGEAGGFALLEKAPPQGRDTVALLGYGESSDGYHMSSPHPEGAGALLAMSDALARAGARPGEVDYVNLHGTGTPANDRAEDAALYALFGDAARASSTKGWTGHTLGAAGIVEAAISVLCLERGFLPGTLNTARPDPALRARIVLESEQRALARVLSNSFGFGGNNCSLLFGRAA